MHLTKNEADTLIRCINIALNEGRYEYTEVQPMLAKLIDISEAAEVRDAYAILDGKPITPTEVAAMLHRIGNLERELQNFVARHDGFDNDDIETLDDTAGKHASRIETLQRDNLKHDTTLRNVSSALVRVVEILARSGNGDAQDILTALKG
jgi:hypothetical protein